MRGHLIVALLVVAAALIPALPVKEKKEEPKEEPPKEGEDEDWVRGTNLITVPCLHLDFLLTKVLAYKHVSKVFHGYANCIGRLSHKIYRLAGAEPRIWTLFEGSGSGPRK